MKFPVGLNTSGAAQFIEWVGANFKGAPLDDYDARAWLSDFSTRLGQDSDSREYEMPGIETNSGNPELFRFTDAMLDFVDDLGADL